MHLSWANPRDVDNGNGAIFNSHFATSDIVTNLSSYSVPEQDYRLSMGANQDYGGSIEMYIDHYFTASHASGQYRLDRDSSTWWGSRSPMRSAMPSG